MKIGILGAGNIARNMANTLNAMEDATFYAIGARDQKRQRNLQKSTALRKRMVLMNNW